MHLVRVLIILLSNINGPTNLVRRFFWESMVLYASRVWAEAPKMTKNKKKLKKAQRSALMRTSAAYSTVSYTALCMLTGNMSIHI